MFHQGSMVALATPFNTDGSVDKPALADLVEWHVEQGTDAIVAVGTSGESATLSVPEHAAVIKQVVSLVRGRIPVIAGTGANSTAEAIELTQHAADAGADACLLVSPYYNQPSQEGLFQHHKAIAQAVAVPQILYNVPGRTALDMAPATTARLSKVDHIVGIKEAYGTVERIKELIEITDDDFMIVTGDDATALESMLAGCHGDISVTANVAPAAMANMCRAAIAGDREAAASFNGPIADLHDVLFLESNPIPMKWALNAMGRCGPTLRLPLTPLASDYHQQVRSALIKAGVLPA